jgi:hypothetical protein
MNPLYVAYAKSQGMSPNEVLARDREKYPGGCMTGFILFVPGMKRKFYKVHPEAFFCTCPNSLADFDAFHRFIEEQAK